MGRLGVGCGDKLLILEEIFKRGLSGRFDVDSKDSQELLIVSR